MKALLLVITLAWTTASLAQASNPERLVCDNESGSTVIVIEGLDMGLPPSEESVHVTASMLIVKLNGAKISDRTSMSGYRYNSAKGPYYEFAATNGYDFFIAAPASNSFSELVKGTSRINLNCE